MAPAPLPGSSLPGVVFSQNVCAGASLAQLLLVVAAVGWVPPKILGLGCRGGLHGRAAELPQERLCGLVCLAAGERML